MFCEINRLISSDDVNQNNVVSKVFPVIHYIDMFLMLHHLNRTQKECIIVDVNVVWKFETNYYVRLIQHLCPEAGKQLHTYM